MDGLELDKDREEQIKKEVMSKAEFRKLFIKNLHEALDEYGKIPGDKE